MSIRANCRVEKRVESAQMLLVKVSTVSVVCGQFVRACHRVWTLTNVIYDIFRFPSRQIFKFRYKKNSKKRLINSLICLKTQAILLHAVFDDLDELITSEVCAVVQLAIFGWFFLRFFLSSPLVLVADWQGSNSSFWRLETFWKKDVKFFNSNLFSGFRKFKQLLSINVRFEHCKKIN